MKLYVNFPDEFYYLSSFLKASIFFNLLIFIMPSEAKQIQI